MRDVRDDHQNLCELASAWLRKPNSRGGHGCHVAFTEARAGQYSGEVPDAIGFRAAGWLDGSVLIECKVSRADFLADAKKPHRQDGNGMGRWRYFMCPEGLIRPSELPARWGLLYVDAKQRITAAAGAVCGLPCNQPDGRNRFRDEAPRWTFENETGREVRLLTHLLFRVGDAEQLNRELIKARSEARRAKEMAEAFHAQLEQERKKQWARMMVEETINA
jgi:hypothetical protein